MVVMISQLSDLLKKMIQLGGQHYANKQWGSNRYGWVDFPVAFAQFRKLVTNHQGVTWMQSQARESSTLYKVKSWLLHDS